MMQRKESRSTCFLPIDLNIFRLFEISGRFSRGKTLMSLLGPLRKNYSMYQGDCRKQACKQAGILMNYSQLWGLRKESRAGLRGPHMNDKPRRMAGRFCRAQHHTESQHRSEERILQKEQQNSYKVRRHLGET